MQVEPPVAYEPYLERFRRATDAILAYNDTAPSPALRWYIDEEAVHDLLGGQSSGIKSHAPLAQYLASRREELELHHRTYGLEPAQNQKRDTWHRLIGIATCVQVVPAVAGEDYIERFQRATDAILAYNDTVSSSELRWYIYTPVVHDLLGGRTSGILRYLVERYLAYRREELAAHHQKHGLKPTHSHKFLRISECLTLEATGGGLPPCKGSTMDSFHLSVRERE